MAILADYRPILMGLTFSLLGAAFYLTYRPRGSGGQSQSASVAARSSGANASAQSKIMTFNKVILWSVTLFAVVFLFFPQTFTNLIASSQGFTSDMERTIVQIEGMT